MIVMGVDPGTALTGIAVAEIKNTNKPPKLLEVDTIKTSAGVDMHKRLKQVHEGMEELSKKYSPEVMVIERLFFNTNVKTAMTVGQARGIYLLVAASSNMHVVEYTALQAKQVLTGYGRSTKKEMQEAVKKYMNLDEIIKPDDANDALALLLCFLEKDYLSTKKDVSN